jgi:putative transposase
MARSPRILYPNAFYHVMNRGGARRTIYQNDEQRLLFLSLLEASSQKFEVEIHAYCLMDNHFHLLIQTPQANLSETLHWITNQYARRINKEMRLDGSLFRGRFKAITIDADNYLVQVSRYIHLNPVKAKICSNPQEYPWSSYKGYIDCDLRPSWLHVDEVMHRMGPFAKTRDYIALVENPSVPSLDEFFRRSGSACILGSKQFSKYLLSTIADSHLRSLARKDKTDAFQRFQQILSAVSENSKTTPDSILSRTQGKHAWARSVTMHFAKCHLGLSNAELAKWFQITDAGVGISLQRYNERLRHDLELCSRIQTIERILEKTDCSI